MCTFELAMKIIFFIAPKNIPVHFMNSYSSSFFFILPNNIKVHTHPSVYIYSSFIKKRLLLYTSFYNIQFLREKICTKYIRLPNIYGEKIPYKSMQIPRKTCYHMGFLGYPMKNMGFL